ncbi:C40 family peptidase [Candidatus Magnetomonas plexicatena]|uniref:C40 family peptidase n=1 Tax=Candidatus Magnetomonas plexicatena TaxID=2552947 RepID=UPI001101FFDC|nr:C40 family peptidase [Nitrospirales bacterium LBB_01]
MEKMMIRLFVLSVLFVFLYGCAEHQVNKGDFHYADGKSWKDDELKTKLLDSKIQNDSATDEFSSANTADHYYNRLTTEPEEDVHVSKRAVLEVNVPKVSLHYLGLRYRRGSDPDRSPYSDCSHLVCAITKRSLTDSGYTFMPNYIPSQSIQANYTFTIQKEDVRPGDLVFFKKAIYAKQRKGKGKKYSKAKHPAGSRIYHVAIVTKVKGDTIYFTHASSDYGVVETSTDSRDWQSYWGKHFHSFGRWRQDVFAKTDNIAKHGESSANIN